MTTSYEGRLGTAPEEGVKAPCVVAALSNITLSGAQTIASTAVVAGNRVLVAGQTDATENGIYDAATGSWTRAKDWNDSQDVIDGQLINAGGTLYVASFTGTFSVGSTEVTFAALTVSNVTTAANVSYTPSAGASVSLKSLFDSVPRFIKYGTTAAATSFTGAVAGFQIETQYRNTNDVAGSGCVVRHTGVTDATESGNWFGVATDGYGYDADGRQFKIAGTATALMYGAVADGSTDNSSLILIATAAEDYLVIPYNVKFDPQTVLATLPTDTVLLDLSGINSFSAAGETNKEFGIFSKDEAVSDTHWAIGSDHHAVLQLNNHGGGGSTSATERKASLLWATGKLENGDADKLGWRGAAIKQFTKGSGDYWVETIRSLAPWDAIAADYERWLTSEVIGATGIYRVNGTNHYVSASTGTTGATAPTHTSGTVSDGAVDWTWVDAADRTVYQIDEYGRVLIGTGSAGYTFFHKVSATDPSTGNYTSKRAARGASKVLTDRMYPTDSGGNEVAIPFLRGAEGVFQVMKSDASTHIVEFSDDDGLTLRENARTWSAAADRDATPSVDGIATLYTANTVATSITALDDGDNGQVVDLVIKDTNTTLVNSSTLMLTGGTNVTTPAVYSVVTFQKVPTSISDRWIEIGRSIK